MCDIKSNTYYLNNQKYKNNLYKFNYLFRKMETCKSMLKSIKYVSISNISIVYSLF